MNHRIVPCRSCSGVSFLEFLSLQRSLKSLSQQRIQHTDEIKKLKYKLKDTGRQLNYAVDEKKRHLALLKSLQTTQVRALPAPCPRTSDVNTHKKREAAPACARAQSGGEQASDRGWRGSAGH